MRTNALIEKLSEIHPKGFDLSLDRISALLDKLGNPHQSIPPVFHVAGTNGKGSTIAFIRAILESNGYKVHVHTSPHLVHWQERYRLGGTLVDDGTLADAIEKVADANGGKPITIFEIMSAVMFVLFNEHHADFSLVEVGLGGRFDATNVIANPVVSAIAPVALDHQAYLGDTLEKIAFEKAGIIKPQCPVVVGNQQDGARNVIEEVAAQTKSPILFSGQDYDWYRDGNGFVFQDESGLLDLPLPRLTGDHQLANAALAIAAVRRSGTDVEEEAYPKAMKAVRWSGRMEKLPPGTITQSFGSNTDIWIDGGHNPAAGRAIADTLLQQHVGKPRELVLICGMINTKEPTGYFAAFKDLDATVITVPVAASDAGISPDELAKHASGSGLEALASDTLEMGIKTAVTKARLHPGTQILFCGSLYLVGEVLAGNGTPPD